VALWFVFSEAIANHKRHRDTEKTFRKRFWGHAVEK